MGIEQVAFEIPPAIQVGLDSGSLVRYGGVVRDAAGHIVAHLQEIAITKDVLSGTNTSQIVEAGFNAGEKVLGFAKKNKYLIAGVTVAAAVTIVGAMVYATAKKKEEKQDGIPSSLVRFNNALLYYVNSIRNGNVTEEGIDNVIRALNEVKRDRETKTLDGNINLQNTDLLNMIRDYTERLTRANHFFVPKDAYIMRDNIIDLQRYLDIQKQMFARTH